MCVSCERPRTPTSDLLRRGGVPLPVPLSAVGFAFRFYRMPRAINPFPSLVLGHAPVGCAEAPEIVPEGPGYRC